VAAAAALATTTRRIVVTGGRNNRSSGLTSTVQLGPGEGLQQLKTKVRKVFGKFSNHKLGMLMLVDDAGAPVRPAKKGDLVEGARVQCTYSFAEGNPGFGGGFGRRGRGRMSNRSIVDLGTFPMRCDLGIF